MKFLSILIPIVVVSILFGGCSSIRNRFNLSEKNIGKLTALGEEEKTASVTIDLEQAAGKYTVQVKTTVTKKGQVVLGTQEDVYVLAPGETESDTPVLSRDADDTKINQILYLHDLNSFALQIGEPIPELAIIQLPDRLITESVMRETPQLGSMHIFFDSVQGDNLKVRLRGPNGETGSAMINPTSGRLIEGTFVLRSAQ